MTIITAPVMGFCGGVRRALEIVDRELRERGPLLVLGPLVHNTTVVNGLEARGGTTVSALEEVPDGARVATTAHGVAPDVLADLERRGCVVVDATCPIVARAQRVAHRLGDATEQVIVFGEEAHREVQGLLAYAGSQAQAALTVTKGLGLRPGSMGVLSQTTQPPERFRAFVDDLRRARQLIDDFVILEENTTCPETTQRYADALRLARDVDVFLVVGSRTSANTRHLLEICHASSRPTFAVASAEAVPTSLTPQQRIGVVSGASTPADVIAAVIERLQLGA
jgi:4-hydroxy-3-methylbut-2-enyl diphosphate reductase